MPWNYDDEEINGIVDSNLKDSPPNPPAVNTAATIRALLKSMWSAISGQVSSAIDYMEQQFGLVQAEISTQLNTTLTTIQTRISQAEAKNESIYQQFLLADGMGTYNASTGVATIRNSVGADITLTPGTVPTVPSGKYFNVVVPGNKSITGTAIDMKINGILISRGVKWDYIPNTDDSVISTQYTDSKVYALVNPTVIAGHRFIAKSNVATLIQPVFAFDASAIDYTTGATGVFSCKILLRNDNVTNLPQTIMYFNASNEIDNISGTAAPGVVASAITPGTILNYVQTRTIPFAKQNFVHCYVNFKPKVDIVATDFIIYDIDYKINGVSAVRIPGAALNRTVAGDAITSVTELSFIPTAASQKASIDAAILPLITPPTIVGTRFQLKGNVAGIMQPVFAFNLSGIDYTTGATALFTCKILFKNNNVINIKETIMYFNNVADIDSVTGSLAPGVVASAITPGVTLSYVQTRSIPFDKQNYVHCYISIDSLVDTTVTDFLIYDVDFKVNGTSGARIPGAAVYRSVAGDVISTVTELAQIPSFKYVDGEIQFVKDLNTATNANITALTTPAAIVGNRFRAKGNSGSRIQPVFAFDASAIDYTTGATIAFTCKILLKNDNIVNIEKCIMYFNGVSDIDSIAGTLAPGDVPVAITPNVTLNYAQSRVIPFEKQNYVHCYLNFVPKVSATVTDIYIYDIDCKINGVSAVRVPGAALYRVTGTDIITAPTDLSPIPTFSYVDGEINTVKALIANILNGKSIWRLGDSTFNGLTELGSTTKTYGYNVALRNKMVDSNYGVNGSRISGSTGMAVRYATLPPVGPDYMLVGTGTNDCTNNVAIGTNADTTVDTYKGALIILCKGLLDRYPATKIGFVTVLNYHVNAKTYTDAMIEICNMFGIKVFDMYRNSGLMPLNDTQRAMFMVSMTDFQHPNELGHKKLVAPIESFVISL